MQKTRSFIWSGFFNIFVYNFYDLIFKRQRESLIINLIRLFLYQLINS